MTATLTVEDIDAELTTIAERLRSPMLREIRAAVRGRVDRLLDARLDATTDRR